MKNLTYTMGKLSKDLDVPSMLSIIRSTRTNDCTTMQTKNVTFNFYKVSNTVVLIDAVNSDNSNKLYMYNIYSDYVYNVNLLTKGLDDDRRAYEYIMSRNVFRSWIFDMIARTPNGERKSEIYVRRDTHMNLDNVSFCEVTNFDIGKSYTVVKLYNVLSGVPNERPSPVMFVVDRGSKDIVEKIKRATNFRIGKGAVA